MVDLDNFKSVNDTYGHDAGDIVLKVFGEILKTNSRRSDICARLDGEEFLMVFTHANENNVRMVLERILNQLREHKFSFGGKTITVTASFGVSSFQGKVPPEFAKLVIKADEELYAAKRAGRNRIEVCAKTPS